MVGVGMDIYHYCNGRDRDGYLSLCCLWVVSVFSLLCVVQGIKFMQEQGLLGNSSDEIAKWLFKAEMLNKRAIGEYLGEG